MFTILLTKWFGEKAITNITALLSSKLFWIITGLITLSGYSGYLGYSHEKAKWRAQIKQINIAAKAQHDVDAKAVESNKLDSIILQTSIKQLQGDANEQISKANAATDNALHSLSLQQRTKRPAESVSPTPNNPTTTIETNSTGRNLSIEDAEFLTRFAGETDLLVINYNQCIASYNKVMNDVNQQKQTGLKPLEVAK